MPFTPLHMGPGLLIKALLQGCFSLIIFGWAQLLMDIQPLLVIITGKGHMHGFSHTYTGATLIAIISAWSGKWVYSLIMKFISNDFTMYQKQLFAVPKKLTTIVCITSALIGTYSHVVLDSIMHADVEPFYPVNTDNHLYSILSIVELYKLCIYSGFIGMLIFFAVRLYHLKK